MSVGTHTFKVSFPIALFLAGAGLQCSVPMCLSAVFGFAVSIMHEDWCWKNKSLEVEVLEDDVSAVEFRQTGYMLRCSLSHAITLVGVACEGSLAWRNAQLVEIAKGVIIVSSQNSFSAS